MTQFSGYHDCPCRDCFEIAIGEARTGQGSIPALWATPTSYRAGYSLRQEWL